MLNYTPKKKKIQNLTGKADDRKVEGGITKILLDPLKDARERINQTNKIERKRKKGVESIFGLRTD